MKRQTWPDGVTIDRRSISIRSLNMAMAAVAKVRWGNIVAGHNEKTVYDDIAFDELRRAMERKKRERRPAGSTNKGND